MTKWWHSKCSVYDNVQINSHVQTTVLGTVQQGWTFHSTHYRSFWGRFYGSDDPTNSSIALKDDGQSTTAEPALEPPAPPGRGGGLRILRGLMSQLVNFFTVHTPLRHIRVQFKTFKSLVLTMTQWQTHSGTAAQVISISHSLFICYLSN